jgi:glycosyltransferase involved in cell wall biosynthesis
MKKKVVLCIPSYNECGSIAHVLQACDAVVQDIARHHDVTILNIDSGSTDGTPATFMETPSLTQKQSLRLPEKGKGRNIFALAKHVTSHGFDCTVIIDADIKAVCPTWIEGLLDPILNDGIDCSFPRRPPMWNRGDLTYHLCYPFMAGVFGMKVREPIAPTQAYSANVMQRLCTMNLDDDALGFGIDILLASMTADMNWVEVSLESPLVHKLRSFSTNPRTITMSNKKYAQVLRTARNIYQSRSGREIPLQMTERTGITIHDPISFGIPGRNDDYDGLVSGLPKILNMLPEHFYSEYGLNTWRRESMNQFTGMPWDTWKQVLGLWLCKEKTSADEAVFVQNMLLCRCAAFYNEVQGVKDWYGIVDAQACDFHNFMTTKGTWPA